MQRLVGSAKLTVKSNLRSVITRVHWVVRVSVHAPAGFEESVWEGGWTGVRDATDAVHTFARSIAPFSCEEVSLITHHNHHHHHHHHRRPTLFADLPLLCRSLRTAHRTGS